MSTFQLEPVYQPPTHAWVTSKDGVVTESIPLVPPSPSSKWKDTLFRVGSVLLFLGFVLVLIVLMYLSGKGKN
jgi:hypothetical protein